MPLLKIYYDRGTVLNQIGVFYEPRTVLGQTCILATHPITIARAFARKFLRNLP
jgi:3-dehydroquinate synthetase